jgi:DNA-binding LacI/PurR family transcriptional regulator
MADSRSPERDESGADDSTIARKVTMAEVAEYAGVSIATVSRVLNQQKSVADEYRVKVNQAVEELSYRPTRLARTSRRASTDMVGVVISDIENPHFTEMIHVAEEEAYRRGYHLLLCNTDESPEKQRSYLQMLAGERPVGVLISPCDPGSPEISQLIDLGIPVVAFDRSLKDPRADAVLADNAEASRIAIDHLAKAGYTRIGYVATSTQIETGAQRLAGYLDAMADRGLETRWVEAGLRLATGYRATEKLLQEWPEMHALLVGNNMLTLGALRALRTEKRRVPEDIAIVAFDDPFWAELVNPPLTTLAQPVRAMTAAAVRLLIDHIEGRRRGPQRIVFRMDLKVRESSGVVADADAAAEGAPVS